MKTLTIISYFILLALTASAQKPVKKDPKAEGRYKSLKEALAEPEKVKSLSSDRKSGIPDSLSKFPNLENFSVYLDEDDKLPADLGKTGKLKRLYILSDAELSWTELLCSLSGIDSITVGAPMSLQTRDSLNKCIPSANLKIFIIGHTKSNKKEAKERKEKERVKCNSVEAALKSEMKDKELYLDGRDDQEDFDRLHEIKDLNKLVIWGFSKRDMDMSAMSGSLTVTDVMIWSEGKINGLNLSRFPNVESLTLIFDNPPPQVKKIPFGLEKLKNIKVLTIGTVYFDEAELAKLKAMFPAAKIVVNHVPVQ